MMKQLQMCGDCSIREFKTDNAGKFMFHRFDPCLEIYFLNIKTHDSESWGQEEAAAIRRETKITRPLSELFTRKTTKKIANALAKLP